jgi:hypothetical protein
VHDVDKAIPPDLRQDSPRAGSPRYRHVPDVRQRVLSKPTTFRPGVLTAQMNEQLDTSDEPFGKVVKPLGFQRRTLSAGAVVATADGRKNWTVLRRASGAAAHSAGRAAPPRDPVQRRRRPIQRSCGNVYESAIRVRWLDATGE